MFLSFSQEFYISEIVVFNYTINDVLFTKVNR